MKAATTGGIRNSATVLEFAAVRIQALGEDQGGDDAADAGPQRWLSLPTVLVDFTPQVLVGEVVSGKGNRRCGARS